MIGTLTRLAAEGLLHAVWQGAAIAGVVAIATRWPGRSDPVAGFRLRWAGLVTIALVPVASVLLGPARSGERPVASPALRVDRGVEDPVGTAGIVPPTALSTGVDAALPAPDVEDPPVEARSRPVAGDPVVSLPATGWVSAFVWIWACVAILLLARVAWGIGTVRRIAHRARPPDRRLAPTIERALAETGRRGVELRLAEGARSPLVVGVVRPTIVVPRRLFDELDPDDLERVIRHELAHVERGDPWRLVVQRLVEAVLFFHPAVRLLARRIDFDREVAADARAVTATGDARAYARCLTRVAALSRRDRVPAIAPGWSRSDGHLARRVGSILEGSSGSGRMRRLAASVAMAALAVVVVTGSESIVGVELPNDDARRDASTITSVDDLERRGDREIANRLETGLDGLAERGFAGSVLVARGPEVVFHRGYGLADRDRGISHGRDTRYSVAGVTKSLTAAAVLVLEAEGRLSTLDPIASHLGPLPPPKDRATIRDLLLHQGGLSGRWADVARTDREAFVRAVAAAEPEFSPGEGVRYTDVGHSLLAAVVERVTGRSFETVVKERILGPAGMRRSGFEPEFAGDPRLAREYVEIDGESVPVSPRPYVWSRRGALGLVTTLGDLHRWALALRDDTVLPDEARRAMFTPRRDDQGYGWEIETTPRGTRLRRRLGGTPGFQVELLDYVDENVVVAFAINDRTGWHGKVWETVEEAVFGSP